MRLVMVTLCASIVGAVVLVGCDKVKPLHPPLPQTETPEAQATPKAQGPGASKQQ